MLCARCTILTQAAYAEGQADAALTYNDPGNAGNWIDKQQAHLLKLNNQVCTCNTESQ